eukprot:1298089-Amorphochlora_amoeboformis.AAC.1
MTKSVSAEPTRTRAMAGMSKPLILHGATTVRSAPSSYTMRNDQPDFFRRRGRGKREGWGWEAVCLMVEMMIQMFPLSSAR